MTVANNNLGGINIFCLIINKSIKLYYPLFNLLIKVYKTTCARFRNISGLVAIQKDGGRKYYDILQWLETSRYLTVFAATEICFVQQENSKWSDLLKTIGK